MTLLEIVAVVALLGIFAAMTASRANGLFANAAARTEVERFAGLLHDAKRRAILTGDSHGVDFTKSGTGVLSAQLVRETSPNNWDPIDDLIETPDGLEITTGDPHIRFSFEGVPLHGGVEILFEGPDQTWRIFVPPHTGAVRVSQTI
ncbi:hypothetical protein LzC2_23480 [Planctomycetes bacterium LzC2]|uniref:Type II secretion system protein GspH n=1 Tax=Alienimonas chondri TaxID=2681879 RepID=A0ABX1VHL7_9PLAN|nr:hypothetical protein [Alienimonas chondri]